MEEKEIEQRVKRIICDNFRILPDAVEKSNDLVRDLGADSLDLACLQMAIEDEFAIVIPEDSATGLNTVVDYVDYVRKQVG